MWGLTDLIWGERPNLGLERPDFESGLSNLVSD